MELKELEKKYEELGKEIERLKKEQRTVGFKDDPIFLLSVEEYEKYRIKIPEVHCWWWLRSPGSDSYWVKAHHSDYAAYISRRGCSVNGYGGRICCDINGVRPALKISNLKSFNHKIKNKRIVLNGVTWVQLDETLFLAEYPIHFMRFDSKTNNYEKSEVRKFLLNWLEERKYLNE